MLRAKIVGSEPLTPDSTVPELPEVETVKRGLNQVTLHQVITGGDVLLDRTIAHPSSIQDFLAGLQGTAIAQWHRRGKYLLAELEKPEARSQKSEGEGVRSQNLEGKEDREEIQNSKFKIQNSPTSQSPIINHQSPPLHLPHSPYVPISSYLGVHLRMTGQLLWVASNTPLPKHTRVRLFFEGDRELRFVDQRTFGQMWWVPPRVAPEAIITGLQRLGPEPFSDEFSITYFAQCLKNRQRPIKSALLDQAIVAGLGNIYADEALFLSGIRPQTLCTRLSRKQIQQLHINIRQVLEASIEAKGTTFSSFRSVDGVNGNYGGIAWVYARDGEPCRTCGMVIERLKLAGRSAHFCPKCQR
ncbi:formamidopyrimidine-DNA glycosylase Fpg [Leptolyngbyaceae cyanobacterium JSC-12]|nr:formamidopyrimidine-DNA glycosylase Fpg [Leptolyngbyaceae cyanobacterium JSC-12]